MKKIEQAIVEAIMTISTISTGVQFTEMEISQVIEKGQVIVDKLQKPKVSDDISEGVWKKLYETQQSVSRLLDNPVFLNATSPGQAGEIGAISSDLKRCIDFSKIDFLQPDPHVSKGVAPVTLDPPRSETK